MRGRRLALQRPSSLTVIMIFHYLFRLAYISGLGIL